MTRAKLFLAGLLISSALSLPALAQQPGQQCVTNAVAGGTADAITVQLLPCGLRTNILILTITANNTTTTPTLQMAGFPALPIYTNTLAAPGLGDFGSAGSVLMLTSTGSSWLIINGNVGGYIPLPLSVANGGTGDATLTSHGVLYGNGTSAVGVTAAGTTGQVLSGSTGSAPVWAALSAGTVTTWSAGTTGFTPNSATSGAVTLAGDLIVANGGTGVTTLTANGLIYGSGTNPVGITAAGTTGQILVGNTGSPASWLTAGTTGQLLVGVTGSAPVWTSTPASGVTSIGFGTTGLTPSAATGGVVTVAGALVVANGGTGLTSVGTSGLPLLSNGTGYAFGALSVVAGGTGQTSYTDGQLLIGNSSGNTLTKASLTAGTGISITPGAGSITIASTATGAVPSYKNANFNAVSGVIYCVDTSGGAVTATMPASAANGDNIQFIDCLHTWATNNLTLARNGLTIMTLAENLTVATQNANFSTVYTSTGGVTTWFIN